MPATSLGLEQAGVVLSKRGKVTAKDIRGEMRILKRGDPLYASDVVCTVRGANVQLKMQDRSIVMLRGGCTFRMSLYRPQASIQAQRYEYIGGALRESHRDASDFNITM